MKLIDLHSHILPNMDDGARDVETSAAMLQAALDQGVVHIAATSHYYSDRQSIADFLSARQTAYIKLLNKIHEKEIMYPQIGLGAEVYLTRGLSAREYLESLCYEGTNIILIELPYEPWGSWVYRELESIIVDRALTVLLAHPERYVSSPWNVKSLREYMQLPLLLQINADSFLSRSGRMILSKLGKFQKPWLLGSDCHNLKQRKNNLSEAAEAIEKYFGKGLTEKIERNTKRFFAAWGEND